MHPLTERRIRSSFVNCSKGEATRLNLPRELGDLPWEDLDFLGWRDPQSPGRGYLVAQHDDRVCGVVLRAPGSSPGAGRSTCSLCLTAHTGGVSLMVAPRAGKAGRQGNSVGTYICADLACSLYVRDKRSTGTATMYETLTVEQRTERLVGNLGAFLDRVVRKPA
jgi:hypothetical protein